MSRPEAFFAAQSPANQPEQIRIADYFDYRTPLDRSGVEIPDFGKGAIAEDKPFLRIDYRDALHHASQDRARTIALAAQRADRAVHPSRRFVQRHGQIGEFVARALGGQGTKISV